MADPTGPSRARMTMSGVAAGIAIGAGAGVVSGNIPLGAGPGLAIGLPGGWVRSKRKA